MCFYVLFSIFFIFFFKQKTAYEMRISDWSSDVCSSDLPLDDVDDSAVRDIHVPRTDEILHLRRGRGARGAADRERVAERAALALREDAGRGEIGGAACRERVCQYV